MKRTLIIAAVVLAAGVGGACDKFSTPSYERRTNTGTGTTTSPGYGRPDNDKMSTPSELKSDLDVQGDILRALNADSALSRQGKHVNVAVNNDKITLSGTVSSGDEKDRVESLAKQNSHGYSVDNNIEVVKP